jgi:hypothetical protein
MLSSLKKNSAYRILVSVLWFLLLLGLPLTSFPVLSRLTGAIVAPFSAIPLAVLMVIWLVPYLVERGKFPIEVLPFFYFILIALIVSALAFFLPGYSARGLTFFGQSFRAYITVGIGLSFYLFFAAFPKNTDTFRKVFLILYISGFFLILWTIFEIFMLRTYGRILEMPAWMRSFRSVLAVQSPSAVFMNRVTGFAYEPSWFVRQFNLVLFPIWLSSVFQRESIFSNKLWVFQVEDLLLVTGLIAFGFSSPRIGLLALLASLAFLYVLFLRKIYRRFITWVIKRRANLPKRMVWIKILLVVLMMVVMFVLASGALVGYITLASRWDYRFELLLRESVLESLDIFPLDETSLIYSARNLAFFERMIYWFGGWNIFNDYPFGVGLGNAGFYFLDRVHGAAYESVELRNLIFRANYLANIKNLWIRLLSETGFIGFSFFLTWLYMLWRSAGLIRGSGSKIMRILGLSGQLFLLAYLVEGVSMDTFAMPYEWVMVGLISAGGVLVRQELAAKDQRPGSSMELN